MPAVEREYSFNNMKYYDELKKSMEWLAGKDDTLFIGQAVADPGTAITTTLKDVSLEKRIEMPVFEETQMGMAIGMALNGSVPITIFPRWNFLLLATNQIVNHLDKLSKISNGQFTPKVIIRTSIGSQRPLNPQHQHIGDFTEAFRKMCTHTEVIRLDEPEQIFDSYRRAYERQDGRSTLIVEWADYYNEK